MNNVRIKRRGSFPRLSLLHPGDFGVFGYLVEDADVGGVFADRLSPDCRTADRSSEIQEVALRVFVEVEEVVRRFFELTRGRAAERDHFHLTTAVCAEVINERDEVAVTGHKD